MPEATLSAGIVIGALLYGGLYTVGLFIAGLWFQIRQVVVGATATAGITYISFAAQIMGGDPWLIVGSVYLSLIVGAATGIVLIIYLLG